MSHDERRSRVSLTPLSGEPRGDAFAGEADHPSAWQRLRRHRRRPPPTTLQGAIARGLLRIAVALVLGTAVALGLSALIDRSTAAGFYIAGVILLAIAFVTSAASFDGTFYTSEERPGREVRVSRSFSYVLVGLALVGIGVVIEATG